MKKFKDDFLLGAATAAHQVEGNNTKSDFWAQEQMAHSMFTEKSGEAVDHYNRYREDITLLAEAGLNAYRFSLEWARIEPEKGLFLKEELQHYAEMINFCREKGVEAIVTLHHFSSPFWLIKEGGWESEKTVEYFSRYVRFVMENIGHKLNYVCTINEANMGLQVAKLAARYRAQAQKDALKKNSGDGEVQLGVDLNKMIENMKYAAAENQALFGTPAPKTFTSGLSEKGDQVIIRAHEAARKVIRELCPELKIGLTLSLHDFQAEAGAEEAAAAEWDEEFLHYLPHIKEDDFLGVQNYTRTRIGKEGILPVPEDAELTLMNYEFYPQALEHVLRKVAQSFDGELLVTENGISTEDDKRRIAFIDQATDGVARCIADGLDVRGYFYWSLLDNFEWQKGFGIPFGLIAVDRENAQQRYPKESLGFLGSLR